MNLQRHPIQPLQLEMYSAEEHSATIRFLNLGQLLYIDRQRLQGPE